LNSEGYSCHHAVLGEISLGSSWNGEKDTKLPLQPTRGKRLGGGGRKKKKGGLEPEGLRRGNGKGGGFQKKKRALGSR